MPVTITAHCKTDKLVITVCDNGAGCDAKTLNDMLASDDSNSSASDSFAIRNVHQRLLNTFGKEYGLY